LPGKIPADKASTASASSVDIAPTILDYLGAAPLAKAHGRSLRVVTDDDRLVFGERGDLEKQLIARMIRTQRWKLSLSPHDPTELYDLENDPGETRNLAALPAQAPVVRKLTAQLLDHMRAIGDPALPKFTKHQQP
jgi:choline-sulfatase